jgi:hypothetical protein
MYFQTEKFLTPVPFKKIRRTGQRELRIPQVDAKKEGWASCRTPGCPGGLTGISGWRCTS